MEKKRLSHIGDDERARMVDVSPKNETVRMARAEAVVRVGPDVAALLRSTGSVAKGNVIETARIAGIMAAKRTAELVPMCHPLLLDHIAIDGDLDGELLTMQCEVRCTGRTGVEMEAMVGASVAALTVYDMCKSASKGIEIEGVRLLTKEGGKSGKWER